MAIKGKKRKERKGRIDYAFKTRSLPIRTEVRGRKKKKEEFAVP